MIRVDAGRDTRPDGRIETRNGQGPPTMSTTRRATNDEALAAFVTRKAEIDAMLERLVAFSDDHFGVAPEEVHWEHLWTAPAMQGVFFCAVTS
jgi:hypothetical protein